VGRARNQRHRACRQLGQQSFIAHFQAAADGAEMILADAGSEETAPDLNQRRSGRRGEAVQRVSIGTRVSFRPTSMTFWGCPTACSDLVSKHMQRNGESL